MITLGFAQVLYVFVRGWDSVGSNLRDGIFLGGSSGLNVGVPGVDALNLAIGSLTGDEVLLGFVHLSQTDVSYYMLGLVVLACYFAMQRIIQSPFGRVMIAIRKNEERAVAVGYDTFRYKLGAFAISAFFAGIAGGLLAGYQRTVSPDESFHFLVAGDALLASIIGGFDTLAGSLFGHLFDETIREFLSKDGGGLLPYLRTHLDEGMMKTELFNGLTVQEGIETFLNGHVSLYVGTLFVLFVPNGLLGTLRDRLGGSVAKELRARFRRYR